MHETAIAYEIVKQATAACRQAGGDRVVGLEIEVGTRAGVDGELLRYALQAVYRGVAKVEIIAIAPQARCHDCHNCFKPSGLFAPCPACGSYRYEFTHGEELRLRAIEIE